MGTTLDCGPTALEELARLHAPTRNRYYYGKLLDAFHLALEQDYGNRKRWLLNRLSLGTGVLCGLRIEASNDRMMVRVGPGVAIDGWGREIVVDGPSPGIDPRQPTDDCGSPVGTPLRRPGRVTLSICYHECEAEPAPVLVSDCERSCENGLIRERYRLRVTPGDAVPPVLVTPEQCKAMFSAAPDKAARRATISRTLANLCSEPSESCVPLAVLDLDANGAIVSIEPVRPRPAVYSNTILFELMLCLADRVDECCPPQAVKSLLAESGSGQTADEGKAVDKPLVARVMQGANPVQGERVTFRVASGLGKIGAPGNLHPDAFDVTTSAEGRAKLAVWELGPIAGTQLVTAEIAAGAPSSVLFSATAVHVPVDLPVVNAIWPSPRMTLAMRDPSTGPLLRWLYEYQSIELVFNHKMKVAQLEKPADWLRLFVVGGIRNQIQARQLALRHATVLEANERSASRAAPAPGEREFFIFDIKGALAAAAQPAAAGGAGMVPAGAGAGRRVRGGAPLAVAAIAPEAFALATAPVSAVFPVVRWVILAKADTGTRNIVDQGAPPLLLAADYRGTALQGTPGSAPGRTLRDDLWDVPVGPAANFGASLWNALTPTAEDLPSGQNGLEGGQLDSYFEIQQ